MDGLFIVLILAAVILLAVLHGEDTRDGRDWQSRCDWPPHGR